MIPKITTVGIVAGLGDPHNLSLNSSGEKTHSKYSSLCLKMKLFFSFFILLIPFTSLNAQEVEKKTSVRHRIQLIPSEEREILERFFQRLFYHGDFSYTLFGLKPMGSIDYNLELIRFPQFYKEPEKHLFLMALDEKGWRVWKRYRNLFPMEKYVFIKVKDDTCFGFLLINKEKALSVIEKNLLLFQALAEEKASARTLLEMLCKGQFAYSHSNTSCLVTYFKALGLLYGYGEENVQTFIKREQLLQMFRNLPIDIKILPSEVINCLEMQESPKTSGKLQYKCFLEGVFLASELKNLLNENHLIKGTKKDNPFLPIKRSLFFGNEELLKTQDIIKSWDDINSSILKMYESENFLETVLERLTSS